MSGYFGQILTVVKASKRRFSKLPLLVNLYEFPVTTYDQADFDAMGFSFHRIVKNSAEPI
ncbi:hypothetical protein GCM10027190_01060 [Spirosoma areae]